MKIKFSRHVDELGRIVLPKEVRDILKLSTGDTVEISVRRGKVIVGKAKERQG